MGNETFYGDGLISLSNNKKRDRRLRLAIEIL